MNLELLERLVRDAGGKKVVAAAAGITRNTLDRAMRGDHVREDSLEKIAKAVGTTLANLRSGQNDNKADGNERRAPVRVWWTTHPVPQMNLHLVANRYGVEPRTILEAAPILFTILAEESLRERRRHADELDSSLQAAMDDELCHRFPNVRYGAFRAQNALWTERASIDARDLDGRRDDADEPGNGSSPFVSFLQLRLKDLGIGALDENDEGGQRGDDSEGTEMDGNKNSGVDTEFFIRVTSLFEEEFEAITTGDERAKFALRGRHTSIRDIPKDLEWVEGEDAERAMARRDWLVGKVLNGAWERHLQELRDIFGDKECI